MIESVKGGVRLHLFIQPKASKNEIIGPHNGELKIKITAPPIEGKANTAVIAFIAEVFGLPKRNVSLVRGDTARHKTVEVSGVDEAQARQVLGLS